MSNASNDKRTRSQLMLPDFDLALNQSPLKNARTVLRNAHQEINGPVQKFADADASSAPQKPIEGADAEDTDDELLLSPKKNEPMAAQMTFCGPGLPSKRPSSPFDTQSSTLAPLSPSQGRESKRPRRDVLENDSKSGTENRRVIAATRAASEPRHGFTRSRHARKGSATLASSQLSQPAPSTAATPSTKGRARSVPLFPSADAFSIPRLDFKNLPPSPRRPKSRSPSKEREPKFRIISNPSIPNRPLDTIPDEAPMDIDEHGSFPARPLPPPGVHWAEHTDVAPDASPRLDPVTPPPATSSPDLLEPVNTDVSPVSLRIRTSGHSESTEDAMVLSTPPQTGKSPSPSSPLTPLPETPHPLKKMSHNQHNPSVTTTTGQQLIKEQPPISHSSSLSRLPRPSMPATSAPPASQSAPKLPKPSEMELPQAFSRIAKGKGKEPVSKPTGNTASTAQPANAFTILMANAASAKGKGKASAKGGSKGTSMAGKAEQVQGKGKGKPQANAPPVKSSLKAKAKMRPREKPRPELVVPASLVTEEEDDTLPLEDSRIEEPHVEVPIVSSSRRSPSLPPPSEIANHVNVDDAILPPRDGSSAETPADAPLSPPIDAADVPPAGLSQAMELLSENTGTNVDDALLPRTADELSAETPAEACASPLIDASAEPGLKSPSQVPLEGDVQTPANVPAEKSLPSLSSTAEGDFRDDPMRMVVDEEPSGVQPEKLPSPSPISENNGAAGSTIVAEVLASSAEHLTEPQVDDSSSTPLSSVEVPSLTPPEPVIMKKRSASRIKPPAPVLRRVTRSVSGRKPPANASLDGAGEVATPAVVDSDATTSFKSNDALETSAAKAAIISPRRSTRPSTCNIASKIPRTPARKQAGPSKSAHSSPSPTKLGRAASMFLARPSVGAAGSSLANLSSALDKLLMPPPARPNTSLGFNRDADNNSDGSDDGELPRTTLDDGVIGRRESIGTSLGLGRPTHGLQRSATLEAHQLQSTSDKPKSTKPVQRLMSQFLVGGSKQSTLDRNKSQPSGSRIGVPGKSRIFGSGTSFLRPGAAPKASKKTSLPSIMGSPVKGSGREDDGSDLAGLSHGAMDISVTSDTVLPDITHPEVLAEFPSLAADGANPGKGKERERPAKDWARNSSRRASSAFQVLSQSLNAHPSPSEESAMMPPPSTPNRSTSSNLSSAGPSSAAKDGGEKETPPVASRRSTRSLTAKSAPGALGKIKGGSDGHVSSKRRKEEEPKKTLDILHECIIFVDVRSTDGTDTSEPFTSALKDMGARLLTRVGQTCTHIVYKDGLSSTVNGWRNMKTKPFVVGVSWVAECAEKLQRVDESRFLIDFQLENVAGVMKRRRSMIPKAIVRDFLDTEVPLRKDDDGDVSMGEPSTSRCMLFSILSAGFLSSLP
ncbi:hypothetical protein HGRIS_002165 [Hohenbuehelia grisea]|uniref:BRCT domain-containing protein n=1 Tax=Hohenbuehelia grisea TaxID=104357 RepID=A0ABR3JL14_9AGAR